MAELSTLARPYAKAAFAYASDGGGLQEWLAQLQVAAAVALEPTIKTLLGDPALTTDQQAQTFIEVCGDALGQSQQGFIRVLASNRRLALLPQICEQFAKLKANQEHTVNVEVVSAFELPEASASRIAEALGKRLQREVVVSNSTDSSLLGGILIRAGDTVIDGSVRGRLQKLAEALTN